MVIALIVCRIPVIMVIAIIINNLYCEEMNWIRHLCNIQYVYLDMTETDELQLI